MTDVSFYHLQSKPLEAALPGLLEKVYESGARAVVLSGLPERLENLDKLLWTYNDRFLPHGTAQDGNAEEQPIYLTAAEENPNGATILVLIDGAEAAALDSYERCLDMFDGNDEAAVKAARVRWQACKDAGHGVTYWRQSEAGKWRKQAD